MASFEVGRRYFGPDESSVVVTGINGDEVTVEKHLSGMTQTLSVAEVEAWKSASSRRIYYPDNPDDRRIKLETFPDPEDTAKTLVRYADIWGVSTTVPQEEWMEWRNPLR